MPRSARLDSPGILQHVIIRGIERRKIFWDDDDRQDLFERLADLLPKTRTACYAWAFLDNHAHFLLRSGPGGMATLMRSVKRLRGQVQPSPQAARSTVSKSL
jgi:REP element-mobilizing transposase RayT